MKKFFLIMLIPAIFLQSCAAMFSGTKETIMVRSNEPGTSLYINEMEVGRDSAVTVVSKKQDLRLRASKKGCSDAQAVGQKSFNAVTLLGLFIDFGIITIIVIDWLATGAIWSFDQTNFVLTPNCNK
ncbi:MAG: hypothetical protein H7A23_00040 [Leptospiraceae bacterium]|nr:hypothetical protein [Nanoarchaeota archaeon]MCP5492919.1 hypothetical protein [Leptospiraceae bacterium]